MGDTGILDRAKLTGRRLGFRLRSRLGREPPDEELEPPRPLVDAIGGSDFRQVGQEFLSHFLQLGGLRPEHRVLDIGCGSGRMAIPLLGALDGGSYEGFDVDRVLVRWCERHITPRNPAFRFRRVSIRSAWFNPSGKLSPESFTFPYPDAEFDFVFAVSMFTHLLEGAAARYLVEAARVLKPGGRLFATFFLLPNGGPPPPEPGFDVQGWPGPLDLSHELGRCRVLDPDKPDRGVAHPQSWVRSQLERSGLDVLAIHPGFWPGRHGVTYQDIMVGERASQPSPP